jgi:hypothetical protein
MEKLKVKRFDRIVLLLMLMMLNVLYDPSCYAYRARTHRAINGSAITQKLLTPTLSKYFQDNFGYSKADDIVNISGACQRQHGQRDCKMLTDNSRRYGITCL